MSDAIELEPDGGDDLRKILAIEALDLSGDHFNPLIIQSMGGVTSRSNR
ncbi:MAG: hypothetical protein ACI8T1_001481 [Verrucomicrobiales bacterium]